MDPVLSEIYKTVLGAAPYVIAAYGLLLVGFFGYVFFVMLRLGKVEKQMAVLEAAVERRSGK